mmetsp:Transcript_11537/g.15585  ORF Transcript_11537/g.15585 Transcript_11537/m.15585 type:complete len:142 (+) Transcript_11537:1311-1736(+)
MYDHMFVLVRNTCRIMMLNYKLKLPIHRDILNPIVVAEVGVMMSITGIFKIWMKTRHKNFRGRYCQMQDYLKMMPRMEQLAEMNQAQGQRATTCRIGSTQISSSDQEQLQMSRVKKSLRKLYGKQIYSTPDDSSISDSIAF